jgi:acyl-coenzyme A thioesterase PaaI-like protein
MSTWYPIDPYTFGAEQSCFGCGPHNHVGLQLKFFREGDEVVTRFVPAHGHEGPPGIFHGGLQATVADELAAWTLIGLRGRMGLTSTIDVRLLRPARMGIEIVGRGTIVSERDRIAIVSTVFKQEEKTTLSGKITFALPTATEAEKILGRPLPDSWVRFSRPEDD